MADQYAYPGGQNNQRKRAPACTPSRSGRSRTLEWIIFALFALDVLCQFLTMLVSVGFWWIGLGDDVLVFMFIMFLITR